MAMTLERRGSEPFVDQSYLLQNPNYGYELLTRLDQLRADACFTDAILCVGHEELPCHRNVLAVSSPYFKAMFSSDLRESKEIRISFNEITSWTLKRIVDYAYTGKLEINVDNAQDLLAAGTLFQYQDIVDACCEFLSRHLHCSNCLGIEHFAHMHNCAKLEQEAHQFALDNFSSVVGNDEFVEITFDRVMKYMSSDHIDVRTEKTVYDAAFKWLHYDESRLQKYTCSVMQHIRFATVDVQYLEDVIVKNPLIYDCEQCSELVQDAKKYHETKTAHHGRRRRSMQAETYTPRPSTVAKEVLVLVGGNNDVKHNSQSVHMYDHHKDKYTPLPDLPQSLKWFSLAAVMNNLYVTGGILQNHIVSTVWKFDSNKRHWSEVKSLLGPRACHVSASLNNKLYVLGGICHSVEGKQILVESIESYDILNDQWTIVGQSPFPRKHSHLVPFNQTLVEIGGTQGEAQVKTMESYLCGDEVVTYSGEQFVLPECIQYAQIIVLDGIFYIIWEDSRHVISLNPEKRTYRRLRDMHYSHVHSGATVLNGKIYVSGGLMDSTPSRIVECYDPVTNTWTVVRSMRQARSSHGSVTIYMC